MLLAIKMRKNMETQYIDSSWETNTWDYNHTAIFAGLRQNDGTPRIMEATTLVGNGVDATREADFATIKRAVLWCLYPI